MSLVKLIVAPVKDQCSTSSYDRTVYTKPEWDLRIFTPVPRGSQEWKAEMKNRTSVERTNKRILVDYGLETACARGKKRLHWWITVHSVNIHLDAKTRRFKLYECKQCR